MTKFSKALCFVFIASLCLEMMMLTIAPAHAALTTMEIFNPIDGTHQFNFTTSQKSVGDTFDINVTVQNVVNMSGWQVGISWNPSFLDFVSLSLPADHVFEYDMVGPYIGDMVFTYTPSAGYVVGGANIGPRAPHNFTGSGRLAVLTLKIIQGVSSSGPRQVQCDLAFESLGTDTFLLSGLGTLDFTPVNAHFKYTAPPPPPASLYISPPKLVDPTLTSGAQFNVSLSIGSATDLNTWSTEILYDNTVLNASGIVEDDFLRSVNSTSFSFTIQQGYNATSGLIQMSCVLSSGGANGNGNLSTIMFQVLGLGQSAIQIVNASLLDSSSLVLPFNTADGYFNNILMAKLSVDPPEVTGSQYVPGTTFTINVTLEGVEDFKSTIFNLTYAPSVIQEIDINTPSVLGQTPIKKLQVDDVAGYVWANITFHSGISTITPVTLMTVQFQVIAMGVSPLNLTNTQLYDVNDNPITHGVQHGIFIGIIRHVAVINVTTDLQIAYQGWNVVVNVTVKNKGNITETFNVHFYYDSTLGGTTTVADLVPDEERVMSMIWNTSTVQPSLSHNYTISGLADPAPYQIDLSDINFTDGPVNIRLLGDVNGDGKVDMRDIAQLVLVFHTFLGKPNWNLLFDLDRNGVVDIRDIAICVMNFGKSAP